MTEAEARRVLKSLGWTWRIRIRNRKTPYIYAERWGKEQKPEEKYIAPLSKLPELTEADIIAKLTQ
jgi:hypothetical protein